MSRDTIAAVEGLLAPVAGTLRIAAELDAAQAEKASPEILATFGIPNNRYLASTAKR